MPIKPENKARYPKNWKAISLSIRHRASWICECIGECGTGHDPGRCTAENGGLTSGGGRVVLTVAHLDHTPENCAPENLKAMCQRCHLNYDKEHHAQTAYRTRKDRLEVADMFGLSPNA